MFGPALVFAAVQQIGPILPAHAGSAAVNLTAPIFAAQINIFPFGRAICFQIAPPDQGARRRTPTHVHARPRTPCSAPRPRDAADGPKRQTGSRYRLCVLTVPVFFCSEFPSLFLCILLFFGSLFFLFLLFSLSTSLGKQRESLLRGSTPGFAGPPPSPFPLILF